MRRDGHTLGNAAGRIRPAPDSSAASLAVGGPTRERRETPVQASRLPFLRGRALGGGSSTGHSHPSLKARLRLSKRPRVLRRGASGVAAARRPRRPRVHPVRPPRTRRRVPDEPREQVAVPIGRDSNRRVARARLPKQLRFHDLCHTCAAMPIHPGCPLRESRITTTSRVVMDSGSGPRSARRDRSRRTPAPLRLCGAAPTTVQS
jgi:hypothetical protein